ncbi:hypothetical protein PMAYCL1PPCAC_06020, partial [Pristionchus mayeri]
RTGLMNRIGLIRLYRQCSSYLSLDLSSSAAQTSIAAHSVVLGTSTALLLLHRLTELLLQLRLLVLGGVAGDHGGLGLVHRGHGGADGGKGGSVGVGRALGRARGLTGGLALGLGVILLGALLVASLLASGIALGGRGRCGRERDGHSDDDGGVHRSSIVHRVLLGALGLAGRLARWSTLLLLITNHDRELLVHGGGRGSGNALRLTGGLAGRSTLGVLVHGLGSRDGGKVLLGRRVLVDRLLVLGLQGARGLARGLTGRSALRLHLVHHGLLLHVLHVLHGVAAHLVRHLLHEPLQVGVVAAGGGLRLSQQRGCMHDQELVVGHVDAVLAAGWLTGLNAGRLVGGLEVGRGTEVTTQLGTNQTTQTERGDLLDGRTSGLASLLALVVASGLLLLDGRALLHTLLLALSALLVAHHLLLKGSRGHDGGHGRGLDGRELAGNVVHLVVNRLLGELRINGSLHVGRGAGLVASLVAVGHGLGLAGLGALGVALLLELLRGACGGAVGVACLVALVLVELGRALLGALLLALGRALGLGHLGGAGAVGGRGHHGCALAGEGGGGLAGARGSRLLGTPTRLTTGSNLLSMGDESSRRKQHEEKLH